MKILFFSDHFLPEPSAPAAHVAERAALWSEWGHQVTVITNAPNTPLGRVYDGYKNKLRFVEDREGVRVIRAKTFIAENRGTVLRLLDYLSFMPSTFGNALLEEKPDVVISTSPHIFVPAAGLAYARSRGIPHVFEVRDLWPASIRATGGLQNDRLYSAIEKLELLMYRKSERIIVFTPSFVEDLRGRGVPKGKIDLVVNGANLRLFRPRETNQELARELGIEGKFVVGYLGTLGLAHGLQNVIDTAAAIENPNVHFLFVGEGAERAQLEEAVRTRKLRNVTFVGRQPKEAMPDYWSICSACLVHLKDDPLFSTVIPSKIFEGMAMGIPIVFVGPSGEGSRIVEERNVGPTVPAASPKELAEELNRLALDLGKQRSFSANSRSAAPDYSRENQARRTLDSLAVAAGQQRDQARRT